MPTTDPLDRAVSEIREFSRFFTRTIGALDYSEQLDTPFTLGEARVLYELARRERTQTQRLREDLGLSAAYLSRMLGRFEEQRLVVRERRTATRDDHKQMPPDWELLDCLDGDDRILIACHKLEMPYVESLFRPRP